MWVSEGCGHWGREVGHIDPSYPSSVGSLAWGEVTDDAWGLTQTFIDGIYVKL